ncbi:hypothetical protein SPI_02866 [Niveomyces insectorum RCEF 264]|uniref:Uncharacterized protein n=1 Tax=Niveomyces insectorum RCEF 264 TaxID=1081102 RepID=A0A167WV79_9HYPO|nr:hypothetical protein SPI_02866 [Niveomyces insectorum RCEF 264]
MAMYIFSLAAAAFVLVAAAPASSSSSSSSSSRLPRSEAPVRHPGVSAALPGSQHVVARYGPYSVPGMDTDGGMGSFSAAAAPPCTDCYITGFQAGLEYPDGRYANTNTSMYMHHVALVNLNRSDATCSGPLGNDTQRIFASGNERLPVDLTVGGSRKAGYYVAPNDTFGLVVELMNSEADARPAVVTLTWDYVAKDARNNTGAGFAAVVPLWLDIDGACGAFTNNSEVAVPADSAVFTYTMPVPWTPAARLDVYAAAGHLHDGGLQLDFVKNGQVVCSSVAAYGETPGYVSPPAAGMGTGMGMGMGTTGMTDADTTHISSLTYCPDLGTTHAGDQWSVTAHYNLTAHPGMETASGASMAIMGIGLMFAVEA